MTLAVDASPGVAGRESSDPTTERILDAAMAQFLDFGIRRTTVEDVAVRAGLSRVTVYRRFARKGDLTRAVILRELGRFLGEFEEAIAGRATLEDKLVEGFVITLRTARTHPLVTRILAKEPETLLPELTIRGGPFLAAAHGFLIAATRDEANGFVAEDVAAIAEIFIRLVASFVLTPGSISLDDDRAARELARRHLAPLLSTARRRRGTPRRRPRTP